MPTASAVRGGASIAVTLTCGTHRSRLPHMSASEGLPLLLSLFGGFSRGRGEDCSSAAKRSDLAEFSRPHRRRRRSVRIGDGAERVEEERGGAGRLAPRHGVPVARARRRSPDARPGARLPRPSLAHKPMICSSTLYLSVFFFLRSD